MAEEDKGFLGRWAQRKNAALQGKPLAEPEPLAKAAPIAVAGEGVPAPAATHAEPSEAEAKVLSLEDVKLLTKESDFKPFMQSGVGPEVRNAAMKKLFADPHFNVMDGLDIYIDDYSIADPLPQSVLRKMASAKFLNLFEDEKEAEKPGSAAPPQRESANIPAPETVAQSDDSPDAISAEAVHPEIPSQTGSLPDPVASQENHDHTDLRLQPDHAPAASGAGRGT